MQRLCGSIFYLQTSIISVPTCSSLGMIPTIWLGWFMRSPLALPQMSGIELPWLWISITLKAEIIWWNLGCKLVVLGPTRRIWAGSKLRPFKLGLCSSIRKGKINQDWSYQFYFLSFFVFVLVNFVSSHSFACKMERTVILVILAYFFPQKIWWKDLKIQKQWSLKKKKVNRKMLEIICLKPSRWLFDHFSR